MSTKTFWECYRFRILGATLGTLFHLGLIGLTLNAKGVAILILVVMDLPLTLLIYPLRWLGIRVWRFDVLIYFIGGTLMYAVLGWCIGPFLERQAILYGFIGRESKKPQSHK